MATFTEIYYKRAKNGNLVRRTEVKEGNILSALREVSIGKYETIPYSRVFMFLTRCSVAFFIAPDRHALKPDNLTNMQIVTDVAEITSKGVIMSMDQWDNLKDYLFSLGLI
jgi:hypothetical protein